MRSKLYRLNLSMSRGALYCTQGDLYNEVQAVQVELIYVWMGLVQYRGVPVQWGPSCTGWTYPCLEGPLYCTDESCTLRSTLSGWTFPCLEGPCTAQRGPSMVKSTLYRLSLSMSGGPLYSTEESLYNEVQAVQAKLIHVWRGLVLYRGDPVQWGPSCTGWTYPCLEGPLYCTDESCTLRSTLSGWTFPCLEGPCTAQRGPSMVKSTLYRLNLSMSGGALVL